MFEIYFQQVEFSITHIVKMFSGNVPIALFGQCKKSKPHLTCADALPMKNSIGLCSRQTGRILSFLLIWSTNQFKSTKSGTLRGSVTETETLFGIDVDKCDNTLVRCYKLLSEWGRLMFMSIKVFVKYRNIILPWWAGLIRLEHVASYTKPQKLVINRRSQMPFCKAFLLHDYLSGDLFLNKKWLPGNP